MEIVVLVLILIVIAGVAIYSRLSDGSSSHSGSGDTVYNDWSGDDSHGSDGGDSDGGGGGDSGGDGGGE